MGIIKLSEEEYNKILNGRYGNNPPLTKTLSYELLGIISSYKGKDFTVRDILNKFLKKGVMLTFPRVKQALEKLCDNYFLEGGGYGTYMKKVGVNYKL